MAGLYSTISQDLRQFSSRGRRDMSCQEAIRDSDLIDGLDVRFLKFFGLWRAINDYRTTGRRNAIMKLEVLMTLLLAAPLIACQCLSYFMIKVDLLKLTFLNLHFLPALQICSKILVFWFRMGSMCKFYDLMRKDFLKIPYNKRAEVKKIFMKMSKMTNVFCSTAFFVNSVSVFLSVADPGVSVEYIARHTGSMAQVTGGKMKILGGWYPVPMAESPYYEAIFVYETILISWGGILLAVYMSLFYQLLMCLYVQFTVLGYHMSSLNIVSDNTGLRNWDASGYTSINKELSEVVQDHQTLLSLTSELKSVYNPLVTMVLGMAIVVFIIAVFQFMFGGSSNFWFMYKFVLFLFYQGIEVGMFCFGSSLLEKASSDLQFAIYSSDWYKADIKFRKTAQMVMLRARRDETLTAIRMYPVNMETIMAIWQFTYSVCMLMSRMI